MNELRKRVAIPHGSEGPPLPEEGVRYLNRIHEAPSRLTVVDWLASFALTTLLVLIVSECHDFTPAPAEPGKSSSGFSEIRALPFLKRLSAIGPKVSGSKENEVEAKGMILTELDIIAKTVTATGVHRIEVETQSPSGCYELPRFDGFNLCYKQVSNIVVRLSPTGNDRHANSVLLNCHYDTWPNSPGASDDGISCALMLEMLRVLATDQTPLQHDVIFLFNGAEENFLQAAHGFITQHRWRHSIRAFINLEAAGAGGRELLFQAGPGNQWLLNAYLAAAPRPHCSVVGQEVFQAGLVPGDTDFRIFRDYGRVPGLDLAYIRNGYVYHTEFDTVRYITNGSLQRAGDNVLATLRNVLMSPYLEHPETYGDHRFVFFDVIGLTTVVYPHHVGTIINMILVAVALLKIWWNLRNGRYTVRDLTTSWKLQVGMAVSIFLVTLLLVQTITFCGAGMAWYARPWYVIPLYLIPGVITGLTFHCHFMEKLDYVDPSASFDAHMVFYVPLLLLMSFYGLSSAVLFATLILFPLLRDAVLFVLGRVLKDPVLGTAACSTSFGCVRDRFWVHALCVAPCQLFNGYVVLMIFGIFIPIFGRSLKAVNPELPLAILAATAALVYLLPLVHFLYETVSLKSMLQFAAIFNAVFYLLVITTDMGDPFYFAEDGPKTRRVHFTHGMRRLFDVDGSLREDNGLFILPYDFRPAEDLPKELFKNAKPVDTSHSNDDFGQIPYYVPVSDILPPSSFRWRAVTEPLQFPHLTEITLDHKSNSGNNRLNYSITVTGADHMSLFVTPQLGWRLDGWSLTERRNKQRVGKNTVAVYLACGVGNCSFSLSLTLLQIDDARAPSNPNDGHELLIGLASQYLHGPRKTSKTLTSIVDQIVQKRRDKDWRWAITPGFWTSDYVSRYF